MRALLVTIAALGLCSSSSMAQLKPERQTGSMIPVKPVNLDRRRAAEVQHGFAQCVYKSNPRAAAALLSHSDPLSSDLPGAGIKSLNASFDMENCLSREASGSESALGLRMPVATVRAMLAEQAYFAAQRQVPKLPEGAVETLARQFVTTGDQLSLAKGMAALSDCVVFHDLGGADALLRTSPSSPSEHIAAIALAPAFGGCLLQGQRFTLNSKSMRAIVADGLWNRFARQIAR